MKDIDIDKIIERLVTAHPNSSEQVIIEEHEILFLITKSRSVILSDPMLLEVATPVNIVGDIHGQFCDLLRYFEMEGYPPTRKYLFLGNYVNRGDHSIETICLLLCYKIKYPDRVLLLRGNHESRDLSARYGMYDSCRKHGGSLLWKKFLTLFDVLPVAAVVDNNIFCVHGGLSPDLVSLDQIRQLPRPSDVPAGGLFSHLLWSNPSHFVDTWGYSGRRSSFVFGPRMVDTFLERFNFDLVIRANEVVDGFYFFTEGLLTVFSAPNYRGEGNDGVLLAIDDHGSFNFKILRPADKRSPSTNN